jgi:amino acid transporter
MEGQNATAAVPERTAYRIKRALLGPPLVTDRLGSERLPNSLALGVLAPDCISSSAYGTEEMLIELLPVFGLAGFALVLPITGVVLVILLLLTLSYRQVVTVYTRAGGSYVVARENFGPRTAQIAAVALLIDYTVTVAVQTSAGTVAVVSAIPALGPYSLEISIGVVVVLAYGNLRGIREAGRAFALPTYLFSLAIGAVIVTGIVREMAGTLPVFDPATMPGTVSVTPQSGLVASVLVLTLLRSFANGGSSLTGLEAISNGVGTFHEPRGQNARRTLVTMASILAFLVAGVSWLAHLTHATPYQSGYPSVISQEARAVFGHGAIGTVLFVLVQAVSALILYTGANTSFNGFPYLASFVAEDSFLPRWLTKRGHRLVFSNGVVVLSVVAIALLAVTGGTVNALVPLYAIGVFTGFTMAGFGMARYHRREREHRWRAKLAINASAGVLSALVVLIFAIVKFTEGAWLIVVLFPVLVVALIRLNGEYRREEQALEVLAPRFGVEPNWSRHVVLVFVDTVDLATLRALRYARGLRARSGGEPIRAVHFVLDQARAEGLSRRWASLAVPDDVSLQLIECRDRRLGRATIELLRREIVDDRTAATVLLPRRVYPALARPLHDRTADHIADQVSRVPNAVATIVPFDITSALRRMHSNDMPTAPTGEPQDTHRRPEVVPKTGRVTSLDGIADQGLVTVECRVHAVDRPGDESEVTVDLVDDTGHFPARFSDPALCQDLTCGAQVRLRGRVTLWRGVLMLSDPEYTLLAEDQSSTGHK